jgi:hypothetical protein
MRGFEELRGLLHGARGDVCKALEDVQEIENIKDDLLQKDEGVGFTKQIGVNGQEDFIISSRDSVQNLNQNEKYCLHKMRVLNIYLDKFYFEKMEFLTRFRKLIKDEFKKFFFNFKKLWANQKRIIKKTENNKKKEIKITENFVKFEEIPKIEPKIQLIDTTLTETNFLDQDKSGCHDLWTKENSGNISPKNIILNEEEIDLLNFDIKPEEPIEQVQSSDNSIEMSNKKERIDLLDDEINESEASQSQEEKSINKEDQVPFNNLYINSKNTLSESCSEKKNQIKENPYYTPEDSLFLSNSKKSQERSTSPPEKINLLPNLDLPQTHYFEEQENKKESKNEINLFEEKNESIEQTPYQNESPKSSESLSSLDDSEYISIYNEETNLDTSVLESPKRYQEHKNLIQEQENPNNNIFEINPNEYKINSPKEPKEEINILESQTVEIDEIKQNLPKKKTGEIEEFIEMASDDNHYKIEYSEIKQKEEPKGYAPVNKMFSLFKSLTSSISTSKKAQFVPEKNVSNKIMEEEKKNIFKSEGDLFRGKGGYSGDYGQLD